MERTEKRKLWATDMDGTLICNQPVNKYGICVAVKGGKNSSFMKNETYDKLMKLINCEDINILPITSRCRTSYLNIYFNKFFDRALVENGAILVSNNKQEEIEWITESREIIKEVKKNKCKEIDAIGMLYGWFGDDHLQTGISAHRKYRKNRTENISQKEGMEEYAPTAMTSKVDDETFLIRFPSCDGDPTLEWVKESVKNYLASGCKHLIIDIRGNGGGSDMFYEPYKELLFDKEGLCVGADIRNTPDHIKFLRSTLNDIPWIKDVIERMEKSTEEFIPLVGDETIKYDSIHPQPLKAAIIIDSGVASSGEQMVLDLKVCSSRTTIYGKGFIRDELCGCTFRISPKSFYQVNPVQTEILYQTAIDFAGLSGREEVLDAYCGIGTIGMIAAKKSEKSNWRRVKW